MTHADEETKARVIDPDDYAPADYGGRGVDIEIWESADTEPHGVIMPALMKINGVNVLTPEANPDGTKTVLKLGNVHRSEGLTATLTVFVRSLTIHAIKPEDAAS